MQLYEIFEDSTLVDIIDELKHRIKPLSSNGNSGTVLGRVFNEKLNEFIKEWHLDKDQHNFAKISESALYELKKGNKMSSILEFSTNTNYAQVRKDLNEFNIFGINLSNGENIVIDQNTRFKCVLLDEEINSLGHNLILIYKDNLFSSSSIDFDFS